MGPLRRRVDPAQGQVDASLFRQERRGAGNQPIDAVEDKPRRAA
jgi:hypothetical protein